jgi:hypothetical protein
MLMGDMVAELSALLSRPETHRLILDGYRGPYSLGITRCPEGPGGLGFLLRVHGEPPPGLPRAVTIADRTIPVVVQGWFQAPQPLANV